MRGMLLTEELASALASRPHIEAVHLSPANYVDSFGQGVWGALARLGYRLKSLHLNVCMTDLDLSLDAPVRRQLPPGLLALTGLGSLDMVLLGHDHEHGAMLGVLQQTPLRSLETDGCTPMEVRCGMRHRHGLPSCLQLLALQAPALLLSAPLTSRQLPHFCHTIATPITPCQVWRCMQLTSLYALDDPIAMPEANHGALPPLRELEIRCRHNNEPFPAVLCGLSRLTMLSLIHCTLSENSGLPPEILKLRRAHWQRRLLSHTASVTCCRLPSCTLFSCSPCCSSLQRLGIWQTPLDAASVANLAPHSPASPTWFSPVSLELQLGTAACLPAHEA